MGRFSYQANEQPGEVRVPVSPDSQEGLMGSVEIVAKQACVIHQAQE